MPPMRTPNVTARVRHLPHAGLAEVFSGYEPAGERVELDGEGAAERGAEVGHLPDVLPEAVAGCAAPPVARLPDPEHGEAREGNAETRRGHDQVLTPATRALLFDVAKS